MRSQATYLPFTNNWPPNRSCKHNCLVASPNTSVAVRYG